MTGRGLRVRKIDALQPRVSIRYLARMATENVVEPGTDDELVARAKAGDLDAFEELVHRHERAVYSLARRMLQNEHDAEDVTQQAFLNALEHLGGFRAEASFSTWLLRIATHAALKA